LINTFGYLIGIAIEFKIPRKVLYGDIVWILDEWDRLAVIAKSPWEGVQIFLGLQNIYLRGRGRRIGNHQGMERNKSLIISFSAVCLEAVSLSKDRYLELKRLGLNTLEGYGAAMANHQTNSTSFAVRQAEEILKELP
jgi:hypothetical protein